MKKMCSQCKKSISIIRFYKDKSHKSGYRHECKECHKKSRQKYLAKDKVKKSRKLYGQQYYQKNKDKMRQGRRIYWKRYYQQNKEKVSAKIKEWQLNLKLDTLKAYGDSICKCCGETQILFLTIDHVNNDGKQDRKKRVGNSRTGGYHFYQALRKANFPDKERYQILCFNCQFGKLRGYRGICPHKATQSL